MVQNLVRRTQSSGKQLPQGLGSLPRSSRTLTALSRRRGSSSQVARLLCRRLPWSVGMQNQVSFWNVMHVVLF